MSAIDAGTARAWNTCMTPIGSICSSTWPRQCAFGVSAERRFTIPSAPATTAATVGMAARRRDWTTVIARSAPAERPRHRRPRDRARHLRVLLQPPQRVLVPLLPVRDVDAHPVALRDELARAALADAEQHLDL